ncbi:hypothetical protein EZI54_06790 [Marinobacter halodurans]|uniref:Type IV secretion protein DotIE n=1 Tax=Marinobacter halodurans TaxID=2528979 RepID=A0ABY1ZPL5_9GAMM|nr:hypothetical protein [Marinobacter halodurans]TBW57357.1 hypothetical protein EZI54_06790 [Marinobacter halodurans]
MNAESVVDMLQESMKSAIGYALNLGGDISTIENVLLTVFVPGIGILISAWAVFDLINARNPRSGKTISTGSIAIRAIVGPATIQLVALMRAVSVSFFGERGSVVRNDMAASYVQSAQQAHDLTAAGLTIGLAFFVLVGWIAGLRAMIAFARIGTPGQDGYNLFKAGMTRLIFGTFLSCFQLVMDDVYASASGDSGQFSSGLNI